MIPRSLEPIAVALCILWTADAMADSPTSPREVVQAFHDALKKGDKQHTLDLLDPDVVIFESGGAELSRKAYASHHMGADMTFAKAAKRTVTDTRGETKGNIAWVITRATIKGNFRGKVVNQHLTESMILSKAQSGWRIIHIHWSSRPAKKHKH